MIQLDCQNIVKILWEFLRIVTLKRFGAPFGRADDLACYPGRYARYEPRLLVHLPGAGACLLLGLIGAD